MAHVRESFPILEDGSQEGVALSKSQNGDASAGKVGATVWAFKDSSGNLVHPQLNSEGAIVVTSEGSGVSKQNSPAAEVAGSLTEVTIAEVTLGTSKTIGKIFAQGSCFKEAIFYLYQQNGITNTLIGSCIVGPGAYTAPINLGIAEYTTGGAGTQKLILKAKNLNKESDLLGQLSCLEFPV